MAAVEGPHRWEAAVAVAVRRHPEAVVVAVVVPWHPVVVVAAAVVRVEAPT